MTRDEIKDVFNTEVTKFRNRFNELDGNIAIQILSSAIAKLQDAGIDADCQIIPKSGEMAFKINTNGSGIYLCGGTIQLANIQLAVTLHKNDGKQDQKILISHFDIRFDQTAEEIKSHEFLISDKNCETKIIKCLLENHARNVVLVENDLHSTLQGGGLHSRPKKVDVLSGSNL